MAKIALGTWAWGAGAFGGDTVFGSKTDAEHRGLVLVSRFFQSAEENFFPCTGKSF